MEVQIPIFEGDAANVRRCQPAAPGRVRRCAACTTAPAPRHGKQRRQPTCARRLPCGPACRPRSCSPGWRNRPPPPRPTASTSARPTSIDGLGGFSEAAAEPLLKALAKAAPCLTPRPSRSTAIRFRACARSARTRSTCSSVARTRSTAMVDKLAARRFPGGGRHLRQRQVLAGQLRSAAGAAPRYMAKRRRVVAMAQFRPGDNPIGALARALAAPGCCSACDDDGLPLDEIIETTLRLSSLGLVDIVEQARLPPGANLLVVVDQFEELFRFRACREGAKAAFGPAEDAIAFVKIAARGYRAKRALPIHVVLTMRSDFLGECSQFHGLPEAINEGQYLVPRLTRDEIAPPSTGPVSVAGAHDHAGAADPAAQRRGRQPRPTVDPAARFEPHLGLLGERRDVDRGRSICRTTTPSAACSMRSTGMPRRPMPRWPIRAISASANSCSGR